MNEGRYVVTHDDMEALMDMAVKHVTGGGIDGIPNVHFSDAECELWGRFCAMIRRAMRAMPMKIFVAEAVYAEGFTRPLRVFTSESDAISYLRWVVTEPEADEIWHSIGQDWTQLRRRPVFVETEFTPKSMTRASFLNARVGRRIADL